VSALLELHVQFSETSQRKPPWDLVIWKIEVSDTTSGYETKDFWNQQKSSLDNTIWKSLVIIQVVSYIKQYSRTV